MIDPARLKIPTLFFFGSLLLFAAVLPGNHTEAEDAFEYARLVEEGRGPERFHPHHLLYLPLQQGLFRAAQCLGWEGRSYPVARAASMAGGAAALGLFYLLLRRLPGSRRGVPLLGTLGLLFSYGFVRYACEVEIYAPALAPMLAALLVARHADGRWWRVAAGIALASLAVLVHAINLAGALAAIPCLYVVESRSWRKALAHACGTAAVVGATYLLVSCVWGTWRPDTGQAPEGWLRLDTLPKAAVGFGQCLLSGNHLFAGEALTARLQALFPYRMLDEEIFLASQMPAWMKAAAPWTFSAALAGLAALWGGLLAAAVRSRTPARSLAWIVLWLGGTLLPTLLVEPSNPELWILALAPFWMLAAGLAASAPAGGRGGALAAAAITLFGLHNLAVGMGSVRSKEGDYHAMKAEWILRHARAGDTVHTADSHIFSFYLRYWSPAEVRNVNTQAWAPGETTYLFHDVFEPPAALGVRYPDHARRVAETAAVLRPLGVRRVEDRFGGIWVVHPAESD